MLDVNGENVSVSTDHMYDMAPISWCIPYDYNVIPGNAVEVTNPNFLRIMRKDIKMSPTVK